MKNYTYPDSEGDEDMKEIINLAGLRTVVVASFLALLLAKSDSKTAPIDSTPNEGICVFNPQSGKMDSCYCIPNPSKNKFAVLIYDGGIYNTSPIRRVINDFMTAACNDVGIPNAGTCVGHSFL